MHKCGTTGCFLPGVVELETQIPPKWEPELKWYCLEHVEVEENRTNEYSGFTVRRKVIPTVGMGATAGIGSDSYPYTVVEVRSPKTIVVQADSYKPAEHHDYYANQEYVYSPNPDAGKEVYTLRKDGRWRKKGSQYQTLTLGFRRHYHDPHF